MKSNQLKQRLRWIMVSVSNAQYRNILWILIVFHDYYKFDLLYFTFVSLKT